MSYGSEGYYVQRTHRSFFRKHVISSLAVVFALGITLAITSLPSATEFLNNYPKYMAINKDVIYSGPLLMKMIEGDLIRKLCEKSS